VIKILLPSREKSKSICHRGTEKKNSGSGSTTPGSVVKIPKQAPHFSAGVIKTATPPKYYLLKSQKFRKTIKQIVSIITVMSFL